MEHVTTKQQLNELLAGTALLYKHSTRCPISARAQREVEKFARQSPITVAQVDVINDKELSEAVAERTGVQHESPQAILIEDGEPSWSATHQAITQAALKNAVK